MPDQIRIAQGRQSGSAFVYLQPAFVSTGKNERVEVIRDMNLRVESSTGSLTDLTWTEQLRLVGDSDSAGLSYEYAGDAVPLLVSARTRHHRCACSMPPMDFSSPPAPTGSR